MLCGVGRFSRASCGLYYCSPASPAQHAPSSSSRPQHAFLATTPPLLPYPPPCTPGLGNLHWRAGDAAAPLPPRGFQAPYRYRGGCRHIGGVGSREGARERGGGGGGAGAARGRRARGGGAAPRSFAGRAARGVRLLEGRQYWVVFSLGTAGGGHPALPAPEISAGDEVSGHWIRGSESLPRRQRGRSAGGMCAGAGGGQLLFECSWRGDATIRCSGGSLGRPRNGGVRQQRRGVRRRGECGGRDRLQVCSPVSRESLPGGRAGCQASAPHLLPGGPDLWQQGGRERGPGSGLQHAELPTLSCGLASRAPGSGGAATLEFVLSFFTSNPKRDWGTRAVLCTTPRVLLTTCCLCSLKIGVAV